MTEEVHVRFDTEHATQPETILAVLRAHFDIAEDARPNFSERGCLVLIPKNAWEMANKTALRNDLQQAGFPGGFSVEATSTHDYP